ncbi:cation:proton antiporter [Roseovarius rhodophyticola]|uniref:Cation:proton antiporter n=1 Tax=Roseovarius rhodophyticola TaxID=3080827 RepID=A0ABZ2TEM8_9RHOB|nr:cation:proton antiporter [Roseovarius sp. W115]MDV2928429.1 cation:proton antiporter [Roseovarius sp. W115]
MEFVGGHETNLEDIAAVCLIAAIAGLILVRIGQPPMVGYILAGLIFGPTGLGFIQSSDGIALLAELGVLLLLFLIGLELSIRAFVLVLRPALVVLAGQLAFSLGLTAVFGAILGWSIEQVLLLGFIVAVSSTAVAIKILEEIDELRTEIGRITVGVMIAQDIALVPMLVLVEALGEETIPAREIVLLITLAMALLAGLIWYLSRPGKFRVPWSDRLTGRPELIILAALAVCLTAATASGLFGLSPVYGAFLAGLILANSTLRAEIIEVTHPVQAILVFVFFLSVGLLIDLEFIVANWEIVVSFAAVVVVLKSFFNVGLIKLSGFSWETALPAGLAMAQIGEFSFILAAVGVKNGVLDDQTYKLALSIIAVTFVISPIWMNAVRRFDAVTSKHLTSLRDWLAESYSPELKELGKGREAVARSLEGLRDSVAGKVDPSTEEDVKSDKSES